MLRRVLTAYAVEVEKALRMKQVYLGPALVLLAVCCAPLGHEMAKDGQSDYGFVAHVVPLALELGLFLLLVLSAGAISSEQGTGSIRLVLVRPLLRHEYLMAKFGLCFTYAMGLTLVAVGGAWMLAAVLGDLRGVNYGGELLYTHTEMARLLVIGALLSLLPQAAAVAFSLLISVSTRSPVAAVSTTVGLWLIVDMLKHPLGIHRFVFTSYLDTWQVFADRCDAIETAWVPQVYWAVATSVLSCAVFMVLAAFVLRRRNLT